MSDNDFIIHHEEPEKKHEPNTENSVETSASDVVSTLTGMVQKSEMAVYASSGELSDFVDNLTSFVDNMPVSEWAQDTYCKQLQEVKDRVQQVVQAKLQELLQKAIAKLNALLEPATALVNINPTDLGSVINFCTAVINFFTAFISLITGLIQEIQSLLTTLAKLMELPAKMVSKASELGCGFINTENSENEE